METAGTTKYDILSVEKDATVKVPKKGGVSTNLNGRQLHYVNPRNINGIEVRGHYTHGFYVQGGPVVNHNYYGLCPEDFGRTIRAEVRIVRKTLPDGRNFILVDVFRKSTMEEYLSSGAPEGLPRLRILNIDQSKRMDGDIHIHGSLGRSYVRFEPYMPRPRRTAVTREVVVTDLP